MKNANSTANDIIIHAAELEDRCEYVPAVSVFLTPAEQAQLFRQVRYPHRLFFWGGFIGAERRAAVFIPEWAADGAPVQEILRWNCPEREEYLRSLVFGDDAPFTDVTGEIVLLRINGSGHRVLGHKDILGSLMGLGVTRQSVGDICMVSDSEAVVALTGRLTEYITDELGKVGSDGVKVSVLDRPWEFAFERQYEESVCTVASLRLDGVVSALTGMSRTKAVEYINAGHVQLSGCVTDDVSREVLVGDTVSVRGYGKYLVFSADGVTRKGRIRVAVKKYS